LNPQQRQARSNRQFVRHHGEAAVHLQPVVPALPVLLKLNSLVPGKSAIVIVGSPKKDLIVIKAVSLKLVPLAIERSRTKFGISVTLNGLAQGTFYSTSRDIFIAAGGGDDRVIIKGAKARTLKLHAVDGTLRVSSVGRAGYTLRAHPRGKPVIFGAAVVGGPLTKA
jgi:hypothetical protein